MYYVVYPRDLLFALFVMLQSFMGTRISLSPLDHSYSFEWPASVVAASISKIPAAHDVLEYVDSFKLQQSRGT